jgi:hypothetical protein
MTVTMVADELTRPEVHWPVSVGVAGTPSHSGGALLGRDVADVVR